MHESFYFLHENWQTGGVERTNIQWTKLLKRKKKRVCLINLNGIEKVPESFDKVFNINNEELNILLSNLKEGDYLIICQPYLLKKVFMHFGALRNNKIKIILAIRNSLRQFENPFYRIVISIALLLISYFLHRIIVNSTEQKKDFPFRYIRNCEVVINPRFDNIKDIPQSNNFNERPNKLVFIGRWADQKGIKFLKRFNEICEEEELEFEAFCQRDHFKFQKPYLTDTLHYLSSNNVAVLFCSIFEGYPNILVEARALGKPILYSTCKTGVNEIMSDYSNGILFEKHNEKSFRESLKSLKKITAIKNDISFASKHLLQNSNLLEVIN